MKKTKRTILQDISTAGFVLADGQLGHAVGGMMVCGDGWTSTSTATLNANGGSDTTTDCTK